MSEITRTMRKSLGEKINSVSEKYNNSQFNKALKNTRCVLKYKVILFGSIFSVLHVLRISRHPYCMLTIIHGVGRETSRIKVG